MPTFQVAPAFNKSTAVTLGTTGAAIGVHNAGATAGTVNLEYYDGSTGTIRINAGDYVIVPIKKFLAGGTIVEADLRALK